MKMIIRADDFGFSEAVNYGILKAFQGGLVKNIGLMSNMPYAKQAFDMIREENVTLGLHVICGRLPDYIDAHAVCTGTTEIAICDIADAYGIDIKGHIEDTRWQGIQTDYTNTEFYKQKLPFVEFFKSYLNYSDRISLIVFHPGYLDYDVIRTSSLTVNRCLDTALLCDAEVKEYLKQHTLLSFKEL